MAMDEPSAEAKPDLMMTLVSPQGKTGPVGWDDNVQLQSGGLFLHSNLTTAMSVGTDHTEEGVDAYSWFIRKLPETLVPGSQGGEQGGAPAEPMCKANAVDKAGDESEAELDEDETYEAPEVPEEESEKLDATPFTTPEEEAADDLDAIMAEEAEVMAREEEEAAEAEAEAERGGDEELEGNEGGCSVREELARDCFAKLDADGTRALSKQEFRVLLASIQAEVTEEDVDKAFKKAKAVGDEMDIDGFCLWAGKKFKKLDDEGYKQAMGLLGGVKLEPDENDEEEGDGNRSPSKQEAESDASNGLMDRAEDATGVDLDADGSVGA